MRIYYKRATQGLLRKTLLGHKKRQASYGLPLSLNRHREAEALDKSLDAVAISKDQALALFDSAQSDNPVLNFNFIP